MANVLTTGEARDALHQIARRFDAGDGEPVYFGSHRRAQGVIVPVEIWERLLEAAEDVLDLQLARKRLGGDGGRGLSRVEVGEVFDRLRAGGAAAADRISAAGEGRGRRASRSRRPRRESR